MKKYIILLPLCIITLGSVTIFLSKEQKNQSENEVALVESNDKTFNNASDEEKTDVDNANVDNTSVQTNTVNNNYVQMQTNNNDENIAYEIESSEKESTENQTETNIQTTTKNYTNNKIINTIGNNNEITIIDKSNGAACAQAIEYFYEDDNYKYYFTCIKSNSIYVIINNKEYKLVTALENGIITINQLEENGIHFKKTEKNLHIM